MKAYSLLLLASFSAFTSIIMAIVGMNKEAILMLVVALFLMVIERLIIKKQS